MNFFEYQDKARSSTKLLLVLFACAVVTLVALTTALAVFAVAFMRGDPTTPAAILEQSRSSPEILFAVSAVVVTIVLLGSIFRLRQLRGGGKALAGALNGRLLNVNTRDDHERKVLNVVEEMAIAAGMPVPQVYVIDDPAINAFAAGYQQQDAVIGITRGCIEHLNRDELQGVVAHEFSHILNGDMRLNIRLIGWLYGITVIGLIGSHLMRSMRYGRRSSRGKGGGGIVLLGLGLVVIGYGGTFFGKLIEAAVSRQREYLADASAVQFTRNAEGIGGALKKMGGHAPGSLITAVDTHEIGHMLFGPGAGFGGAFATHPKLEQRIRRIDPRWDGAFIAPAPTQPQADEMQQQRSRPDAQQIFRDVGLLTTAGLAAARERLQALPPEMRDAVHNTLASSMLAFALLVAQSDSAMRKRQLTYLQEELSAADWAELVRMLAEVAKLERTSYLPLVELAAPALRELSPAQCETYFAQLRHLIDLDATVNLFEWCLFHMVRSALMRKAEPRKPRNTLAQCHDASRTLLAALAHAGHADEAEIAKAFAAGLEELEGSSVKEVMPAAGDLKALDAALECLIDLEPLQKPRLLKALARCARADGKLTLEEQELLRAIGAVLDCPTPPLR